MLTEAQMVCRVEDLVDVGIVEQLTAWTPDDGPQHLSKRPAHWIMLVRALPCECGMKVISSGSKGLCRSGIKPCALRFQSAGKVYAKVLQNLLMPCHHEFPPELLQVLPWTP